MTTVKLLGGATVYIDFELDKGKCRGCRKQIFWSTTCNGKKMPICKNDKEEWQSHFAACTKASVFRKTDYIPKTNGVDDIYNKWIPRI